MAAGLSTLGIIHTAISLVAVAAGIAAMVRYKEITPDNTSGRTYLIGTLLTAATGLGIFARGVFGPPHVLALMTLAALALGMAAARTGTFGRASHYVMAISFSITLLFHAIPAVTETLTRVPVDAPVAASPEAPIFQVLYPVLITLYLVGQVIQVLAIRRGSSVGAGPLPS